ncbi:hypothetical protein M8C21_005967, partial [Ambrosia artemisiifolia]
GVIKQNNQTSRIIKEIPRKQTTTRVNTAEAAKPQSHIRNITQLQGHFYPDRNKANTPHDLLTLSMSILDKLWDDTLAGPRPDKGLGKLRKQSTFSFRSSSDSSGKESQPVTSVPAEDPAMRVTRSIMIVKPERTQGETPPASPAGSTPPVSPFPGKV